MKRRASNDFDSRRAENLSTGRGVAKPFDFDDSFDERSTVKPIEYTLVESVGNDALLLATQRENKSCCDNNDGSFYAGHEVTVEAGDGTTPVDDPYICYGTICDVNCQLLESARCYDTSQLSRSLLPEDYILLSFGIQSKKCIIADVKDSSLFQVNAKVSQAIIRASNSSELHFDAYAKHEDVVNSIKEFASKKAKKCTLRLHANVYGLKSETERNGASFSASGIFFQEPLWQPADRSYDNPHMIKFNNVSEGDIWLAELSLTATGHGQFSTWQQWGIVLNDLPQHHFNIDQLENKCLKSTLFRHQQEACNYMIRREIGDLEAPMRLWSIEANDDGVPIHRHNVVKTETMSTPLEPRGGILADDMGLGKTLSAISLITSAIARAEAFATQSKPEKTATATLTRTKATLVVVPSLLLMQEWIKEIQRRTLPGAVRITRYHGHERSKHYRDLLDFDIVLTTYGTITTEYRKSYHRGREVLYFLEWFRIILDEAHTIRSQRTRQFDAIMNLHGNHHWCLTGTPISNKIEDVGALLRFCRVPLLQDSPCFRDNVTKVAKRSFSQGCRVLRQVLAPICLRRTKNLLNIPPPQMIEKLVEFTQTERSRYGDVEAYSRRLLILSSTSKKATVSRHTMLQAILRLRICCNLGTHMRVTDADAEEHLDPDEAWTLLEEKGGEVACASCSCQVRLINQLDDQDSGTLGTCSHVLCGSCKESISGKGTKQNSFMCPICNQLASQQILPLGDTMRKGTTAKEVPTSAKIKRLIEDLLETKQGHKSIVFSAWRKTLDIASEACTNAGIAHVRIDGCTPQLDRSRSLEMFTTSANTPVLLITFGTGAQGLNLAAATRIHVLEPQWNPSVEEQAIGRAVRIGQEKHATIVRYIVKDTIEQQIQSYQRRKINLAAGGFGDDLQHTEQDAKLSAKWLYTHQHRE